MFFFSLADCHWIFRPSVNSSSQWCNKWCYVCSCIRHLLYNTPPYWSSLFGCTGSSGPHHLHDFILQVSELQACTTMLKLYLGDSNSNSDLYTYTASILTNRVATPACPFLLELHFISLHSWYFNLLIFPKVVFPANYSDKHMQAVSSCPLLIYSGFIPKMVLCQRCF